MSEINAVNPAPEEAAGSLLRQARESQRMSIEHLASVVKVPVGKLQALESEDWSTLSDPNLARALAMTVCRALKVDSSPIMSRMPAAVAISLGGGREPLNQPFKEFSHTGLTFERSPRMSFRLPRLSSTFVAPLVLLMVAAGIYLMPEQVDWQSWLPDRSPTVAETASAPLLSASDVPLAQVEVIPSPDVASAASQAAIVAASAPAMPAASAAVAASAVVTTPVLAAQVTAPASAPAPAKPASTAVPLVAAVQPSAPLPASVSASVASIGAGGSRLTLSAKEPAWVEIRDANGAKIFSRQLAAGERVDLQGKAPLKVHAGNAPTLSMQFNGQPVDLAAVTRMNVARIELK